MAQENTEQTKNSERSSTHPTELQPECLQCGSTNVCRDGIRYNINGEVIQRWLCKKCSYRFSKKHSNKSGASQHAQKVDRQILNCADALFSNCQGSCEALSGAPTGQHRLVQTLAEVENLPKSGLAGATEIAKIEPAGVKGKIIDFLWWMEKQGYARETIRCSNSCLRTLIKKGANLLDPESVKEVLAKEKSWGQNRRRNIINAYTLFLKFNGSNWEKPKCKVEHKIAFIPLEQEIDALIAGSGKKLAASLQLIKETAFRAGETKRLRWTNIDFEKRLIILNEPEKGSNSGIYKVSQRLIDMINALPRKSGYVFPNRSVNSLKVTFLKTRKTFSSKTSKPEVTADKLSHFAPLERHDGIPQNQRHSTRHEILEA